MLPTHYTRVPNAPTQLRLPFWKNAAARLLPQRPVRWLPFVIAVPIVLYFLFPFPLDFPRTGRPDFGWHSQPPPPPPHHPPFHTDTTASTLWSKRADQVRAAYVHAYSGYTAHAFPADELLPITGGKVNNFVGWGVSVFDSLDTIWIMGLDDFFYDAVKFVADVDFSQTEEFAPFFETVIRYLGGLLSAYALSGEPVLLAQADHLAAGLIHAFNTPTGIPEFAINVKTGNVRSGWSAWYIWSEFTTCQMEFKYLAHVTGKQQYYKKVERIMSMMHDYKNITHGFPIFWSKETGLPMDQKFSVGASADSGYEYFLKQWLLSGQSETKVRELYITTANLIIGKLLYVTPKRKLLYVTDTANGIPSHVFEHLSCFLPGLLALGAHTLPLSPEEKELHMWAAKGLAYSCWLSYADQPTGLGPDVMQMKSHPVYEDGLWITQVQEWEKDGRPGGVPPGLTEPHPEQDPSLKDYISRSPSYMLRPETIESLYVLWKTTGDKKWRERGWTIFEAIEKHARTDLGYANVRDVTQANLTLSNEMPSWFLAETLKYLYLLFNEEDVIPFDTYVFNTEAHPLPIFQWTRSEKDLYNIPS